MTTFIQNDGRITTAATSDAPELPPCSQRLCGMTDGPPFVCGAGRGEPCQRPRFSAPKLYTETEVAALIAEVRREVWNAAIEAGVVALQAETGFDDDHPAVCELRALKEETP